MPRSRKARNMTGGTNSDSTWGVSCENIVSAVCTTYYGTNGTQPSLTDCDTQNIEFFADWNWKISQIIPVLLLKSSVVNKDLTFKAKDLTLKAKSKAKDLTSEHVEGPL